MTHLDLSLLFSSAPIIYSALLALSLFALTLWLYTLFSMRPGRMVGAELDQSHLLGRIYAAGEVARAQGHKAIVEAMEAEGRRAGATLWQRISLLSDVAMIAPMLGLLGTVMGLFLAFYDLNRTSDDLSSLFDGLGLAIGTTVAGLIVAILAMIFHTTLKMRAVKVLAEVESRAVALAPSLEGAP